MTFTKEQNKELTELLEDMRYDTFVDRVEEFTGDINLGYELLGKFYEKMSRI